MGTTTTPNRFKKIAAKVKRRKDADATSAPASTAGASASSLLVPASDVAPAQTPAQAQAQAVTTPMAFAQDSGQAGPVSTRTTVTVAEDPRLAAAQDSLAVATRELEKEIELHMLNKRKKESHSQLLSACFVAGSVATTAPAFAKSLSDPDPAGLVLFVDQVSTSHADKKVTRSGRVYDVVSKMKPFLNLFLAVASDAADLAPAGGKIAAKGVVGVFGLLLDAVAEEQARSDEILKVLGEVSFHIRRVLVTQEVRVGTTVVISSILRIQETDLLTASTAYLCCVLESLRHGFFHNMVRSAFHSEYADSKDSLLKAVRQFDQALLTQVLHTVHKSQDMLSKTTKTDISDWLQAAYESVKGQYDLNFNAREEGTCEWILDLPDFQTWQIGPVGKPSVFWLNAPPGTGKSTITAFVVSSLIVLHPKAAVAYFFCKNANETLKHLPVLVRTIAAQLSSQLPHMQTHLERLQEDKTFDPCDSRAEKDGGRAKRLFKKLIFDGLVSSGATAASGGKDIFIVLDGIDELEQRAELSWFLEDLEKLPAKVLVSSRKESKILEKLEHVALKYCVQIDDVRADIYTHISSTIDASPGLKGAFQLIPVAPDPSTFLTKKANGNFQYVHLVLDDLKKASDKGVEEFEKALYTLPTGVQDMYRRVLERLEQDEYLETARIVILCLLYAYRRLSVAELECLVAACLGKTPHNAFFDFARAIDKHCGVVLQRVGNSFIIAHETFKEYMLDPWVASAAYDDSDDSDDDNDNGDGIVVVDDKDSSASNPYALFYLPSHIQLTLACMRILSRNPKKSGGEAAASQYAAYGWFFHSSILSVLRNSDKNQYLRHLTRADTASLLCHIRNFVESPAFLRWTKRSLPAYYVKLFLNYYVKSIPDDLSLAWTAVNVDVRDSSGGNGNDAKYLNISAAKIDDATVAMDWMSRGSFIQTIRVAFCRTVLQTDWHDAATFSNVCGIVSRVLDDNYDDFNLLLSPPLMKWTILKEIGRLGGLTPQSSGLPAGNYACIALNIACGSSEILDKQALRENEDQLRRALQDFPTCEYWNMQLVMYLATQGRAEDALVVAREPAESGLDNYYYYIGTILARKKHLKEAEDMYRRGLAEIDEEEQAGVTIRFWEGLCRLWARTDPARHVALLREAMAKNPAHQEKFARMLFSAEELAAKRSHNTVNKVDEAKHVEVVNEAIDEEYRKQLDQQVNQLHQATSHLEAVNKAGAVKQVYHEILVEELRHSLLYAAKITLPVFACYMFLRWIGWL